jgi:uncharacterized membrane protein
MLSWTIFLNVMMYLDIPNHLRKLYTLKMMLVSTDLASLQGSARDGLDAAKALHAAWLLRIANQIVQGCADHRARTEFFHRACVFSRRPRGC